MRLYAQTKRTGLRNLSLSLVLFAAVLFLFLFYLHVLSGNLEAENQKNTQEAIRNAAAACYAIEGFYPENVRYLEDHYGVQIDHSRYVISYQNIGANVAPYIELVPVGGEPVS